MTGWIIIFENSAGAELCWLAQDMLRNSEFPMSCKSAAVFNPSICLSGIAHCASQPLSQRPNSIYVAPSQRVFRVDRHRQGFDCGQMQFSKQFDIALRRSRLAKMNPPGNGRPGARLIAQTTNPFAAPRYTSETRNI